MADAKPLQMHHLKPAPGAKTARTRVGRGEASKGKTAGRGTKGTKARYQVASRFEGGSMPIHMRLPKLRGFKNPNKVTYQVVNLDKIAQAYPNGGQVTVEDLIAKKLIRKGKTDHGVYVPPAVKILSEGHIHVAVDIADDIKVSTVAGRKIGKAGGSFNPADAKED